MDTDTKVEIGEGGKLMMADELVLALILSNLARISGQCLGK